MFRFIVLLEDPEFFFFFNPNLSIDFCKLPCKISRYWRWSSIPSMNTSSPAPVAAMAPQTISFDLRLLWEPSFMDSLCYFASPNFSEVVPCKIILTFISKHYVDDVLFCKTQLLFLIFCRSERFSSVYCETLHFKRSLHIFLHFKRSLHIFLHL